MAERNTTYNAGPPIDPAPSIGARVAVHGWPFFDGEPGTVTSVLTLPRTRYVVRLDSEPDIEYPFAPGELEALND